MLELSTNIGILIIFLWHSQVFRKNKDAAKFIRFEFMGRNYAGINSKPITPPSDLKNVISFFEQKASMKHGNG